LAGNIYKKTISIVGPDFFEIQIECDWNASTRESYFLLLRTIRAQLHAGKILSGTIRLHQIKYRAQTGVPPLDRGVLMFYGMGDPASPGEKNSILDLDTARKYTAYLKNYPLFLDAALPVYQWGILFHEDHFRGIIRSLGESDLTDFDRSA